MRRPLAIDLYCGLGGWAEGLLAEGWDCIGFDIERHVYVDKDGNVHQYPAQLVIQDVLTLHGSQFRNADLIVASPPCQGYSYRAMPWKRAKALPPPDNSLFEACFRIQREACEAAGRHIPMIVENVRGAQKWVGRARWNYGSFYLWGDVPALMPVTLRASKVSGFRFDGSGRSFQTASVEQSGVKVGMGSWRHPDDPRHVPGLGFNTHADRNLREAGIKNPGGGSWNQDRPSWTPDHSWDSGQKNTGGSWFNIAHNTTSGKGQNPDGRKTLGKIPHIRDGAAHTKHLTNPAEHGRKQGGDWFAEARKGGKGGTSASFGSKSSQRKMASAMIAKIPLPLSRYIAATFKPSHNQDTALEAAE